MNWQEIANSIANAFRNAGVKKDVIDLQEKKLGLLTKEIETLTTENAELKTKMANLEKELDSFRPKTRIIEEIEINFLGLLFNQDLSVAAIAQQLGIDVGLANYHKDALIDAGMVQWTSTGIKSAWMGTDRPATLGISPKGRAYLVQNKLV
jgi:hypothetical protein